MDNLLILKAMREVVVRNVIDNELSIVRLHTNNHNQFCFFILLLLKTNNFKIRKIFKNSYLLESLYGKPPKKV